MQEIDAGVPDLRGIIIAYCSTRNLSLSCCVVISGSMGEQRTASCYNDSCRSSVHEIGCTRLVNDMWWLWSWILWYQKFLSWMISHADAAWHLMLLLFYLFIIAVVLGLYWLPIAGSVLVLGSCSSSTWGWITLPFFFLSAEWFEIPCSFLFHYSWSNNC